MARRSSEGEPPERALSATELPEYPGRPVDPETVEPTELQRLVTIRETQLSEYVQRAQTAEEQQAALRVQLDEAQQARAGAESQIPILRDDLERRGQEIELLRARQGELETQLTQVRADYETRLGDVVRQAVEEEQQRHLEELKRVEAERQQLEETVKALQEQLGASAETRSAPPASLADSFIETLEHVAAREVADRPFDVSLSRMEVEARGILRAPSDDTPTEFVTLPPGQVNPAELSTVRMEFRLAPKPPGSSES